jgi:type I restriction enzyme S subunit
LSKTAEAPTSPNIILKPGWTKKPLNAVTTKIGSGSTPLGGESAYKKTGISLIRSLNVHDGGFTRKDLAYIDDAQAMLLANVTVEPDDILLNITGASVARCCIVPSDVLPARVNQHVAIIRSQTNVILPSFLHYLLISPLWKRLLLQAGDGGSTRQALTKGWLTSFEISFPDSLKEQERIVAILDEAFAGITGAERNTLSQISNSAAAFASQLDYTLSTESADWKTATLSEVCQIARGGSPRPIEAFLTDSPDGINWIKISDATASAKYIYRTQQRIIPAGARRSRMVHDGDFLLSNSMSFGRPYIMKTDGCIHDGWLVLSNYQENLDQDFLYLLLGSRSLYRQFDSLAAGSTVRNLNKDLASRARVRFPGLERQKVLAKDLEHLQCTLEDMTFVFKKKLAALKALRQSLLHQAFSGNL